LLRQKFPTATPTQIRNAVIASANPGVLSDGSTVLDQGAGYVNGAAAATLLASGGAANVVPPLPNSNTSVKVNIEQGSFLRVRDGFVTEHASNLKPGQRHEIVYRVAPNTSKVVIMLTNVTPTLPPEEQNPLFGDDILFTVHTAKTSSIGEGDYPFYEFTAGGTFAVDNPEAGMMRITVNGDWTNAGTVSADVAVLSVTDAVPQLSSQGKIANQEMVTIPVNVPAGVAKAEFRLSWREDWGNYPSADLDLILIAPGGALNFAGATINNPENAVVNNPAPGTWVAVVSGFEIHTDSDKYELRVALDGKVVKQHHRPYTRSAYESVRQRFDSVTTHRYRLCSRRRRDVDRHHCRSTG